MNQIELSRKIQVVTESLEMMGLKLLAECARTCQTEEYIQGMAELAKAEAFKRNEISIALRLQ